jgi:hypothetical protein
VVILRAKKSKRRNSTDVGTLSGVGVNYAHNVPSTVTNASLSFGQHYAVLNLDLIEALVSSVNMTTDGKSFINNTATWINAVHQ